MNKPFRIMAMTLGCLVAMDILIAGVLSLAETRIPALRPLLGYFEYGRSVPGKLEQWTETPGAPGNLYSVAWMPEVIDESARKFAEESPDAATVVRSYGMSFVNNIVLAANAEQPDMAVDIHAGPGAPPNFTYALFLDDAANRREGDVVVLGILSSAVPALTAMSNRTWMFEQPAPFTYPVFRSSADGSLTRIDPLVRDEAAERALANDPKAAAAWKAQLREEDAFYSPITFGAAVLDYSPFLRLVRRALAVNLIDHRELLLQADEQATLLPLRQIVADFSDRARQDGLLPVVFLIQTRDPLDLDLLSLLRSDLVTHDIPYLATAEHVDPSEPDNFIGDGHYKKSVDMVFADAFLEILREHKVLP